MSIKILESLNEFWALIWRMTWNYGLDLRTTSFELGKLDHSYMEAVLCMWFEAFKHIQAFSCMWLGVYIGEKEPQIRVWSPRVVLWPLSVL